MRKPFLSAFSAGLFTLFTVAPAHSALVVPAGLNPGDAYHVIFVSTTTRDATSVNITDYDAHVQAAADAAGIGASVRVAWRVVGSTPSIDAKDHLSPLFSSTTTVPIYLQNGNLVSPSLDALFDGAIDVPIQVDENGFLGPARSVWTGSTASGTGIAGSRLGDTTSWVGLEHVSDSSWIQSTTARTNTGRQRRFYGMSSELVVPAVPVPAAVWLFGSGLLGLMGIARRKRV